MKDLRSAQQMLGMKISHDRKAYKIWLSPERYIEKVLERFNMVKAKSIGSPLVDHFKLSSEQSPSSKKRKRRNKKSSLCISRKKFDVCHGVHEA